MSSSGLSRCQAVPRRQIPPAVLVELAPEYGQTARLRKEGIRPAWTTETDEQMAKHRKMSLNALDKVDATITHLSQLPEVINELLKGGDDDE